MGSILSGGRARGIGVDPWSHPEPGPEETWWSPLVAGADREAGAAPAA